ncbi:MAG TPA: S8 family serine peptidase [Verrucomicrobiae bacterium]|nr:S8 family serine peptidase [Verrucomicrobiae bacterium]
MMNRTVLSLLAGFLFLAISNSAAAAQIQILVTSVTSPTPAPAPSQVIVRDTQGQNALQFTCFLLNCSVTEGLDGSLGQVFLVTVPLNVPVTAFLQELTGQLGIADAEPDLLLHVMQSQTPPSALYDTSPVNYFGTTVWDGYVNQPAANIINLQAAQSSFHVTGAGTVAVIDTGVDPNHPVLQGILVPGRDFTRNQSGGSELGDLNQSTMAVVNGAYVAQVNQSTMAVVNQQGDSTFSQSQYAAFGHGTMVSGIIHLVAPTAHIMPLKAFRADGTGNLSDVLRAIYYATNNGANILNMSFDFPTYSTELAKAVDRATDQGVISVASVGNDGQQVVVYPAGLNNVIGVASTTNNDTLSSFSNYGQPPVWLGAPGEGVVTTYPYGTYAAGWGTSFSTPLASGTVALMWSAGGDLDPGAAARALSHASYISPALGHGRLDSYQAVAAWCQASQRC